MPLPPRLPVCVGLLVAALTLAAGLGAAPAVPASRPEDHAAIRALLAGGDAAQALEQVDRVLAAQPRDAQLQFLRGVALMDLRRDEDSLAQFERTSQEFPELPDPLNNIALLRVRAGQLEQARQALEVALRNDPGHRTARANLGLVHLMLAAQAWQQLAASGPIDASLARRLEGVRALLAGADR
jgi:Flp pilus assembly protein TadD